ncbi:MAG: sulfatase [Planctomycetota bacterium]
MDDSLIAMQSLRCRALFAVVLCFVGPVAAQGDGLAGSAPPRPNVLILLADDQGYGDVGYHNEAVYSPNIDALAARGTRFTHHYVMPQCTPTRVALLTGRYPSRFGPRAQQASNALAVPLGTVTVASALRSLGYRTALVGKWHLGSRPEHGPNHFGFEHSYGSLTGAVGMYDHRYRKGAFAETWHRDHAPLENHENGVHATDLVAREAVRVIEAGAGQNKPWFLYVPFHAIHTPLDERGRFVDEPTALDPDRKGRWRHEDEIVWFHDPEGLIQRESDPEKRLLLAAVHHMDHAVGRIVDALRRTGQLESTLILYSSDNGPQVNWPGNAYPDDLKLTDFNQPIAMRGHKTHTYEGGIRVPGFAVWPGRIPAKDESMPVHIVDWMPTLLAVLGGVQDRELDGRNISSLLGIRGVGGVAGRSTEEQGSLRERELYWVWSASSNRRALRCGRWKIVRYGKDEPGSAGDWQLFDLEQDPLEAANVAESNPEVLQDMHARFLRQRSRDRLRRAN